MNLTVLYVVNAIELDISTHDFIKAFVKTYVKFVNLKIIKIQQLKDKVGTQSAKAFPFLLAGVSSNSHTSLVTVYNDKATATPFPVIVFTH